MEVVLLVVGLLFFWLMLCIIVGVAANTRGRVAVGWFLLAVVISPLLAGLLLLALPKKRKAKPLPTPGFALRLTPRSALRLIVVPLIGIVAVLLYYGLHDRFFLPECDSDRAKHTLADILKPLKLEPTQYEPLTTVSTTKTQVVCKAIMPLPDGGSVAVDYSFYWQGSQANIRYSVTRQ
jgi:hypothetical protein